MEKHALFIGRWQPFHNGHRWLIDQKLAKGIPVLIAVRDIPPDEKNPFTAMQSVQMLATALEDHGDLVKFMIIPDIESVNWGRGVGYETNEHQPPENVGRVSATEIRRCILEGDESWKEVVNPKIHEDVIGLMRDNGYLDEMEEKELI